ncbi:MAG: hypothetical protein IID41_06725 [Planctomycetes bacterium]|nr:hypothetical protein [Planctomycetota bacterium]
MPDTSLDEDKALEAVEERHWQLLRWCNKNGLENGLFRIERFIQKCLAVRDVADRLNLLSVVLDCDDRIWYWSIKESYVTHKVRHRIPVLRYRRTTRHPRSGQWAVIPVSTYETERFLRVRSDLAGFLPAPSPVIHRIEVGQPVLVSYYYGFPKQWWFSLDQLRSRRTRQPEFLEALGQSIEETVWNLGVDEPAGRLDDPLGLVSRDWLTKEQDPFQRFSSGFGRAPRTRPRGHMDYETIELHGLYVIWDKAIPGSLAMMAAMVVYD